MWRFLHQSEAMRTTAATVEKVKEDPNKRVLLHVVEPEEMITPANLVAPGEISAETRLYQSVEKSIRDA